jgi:hypothetical protein
VINPQMVNPPIESTDEFRHALLELGGQGGAGLVAVARDALAQHQVDRIDVRLRELKMLRLAIACAGAREGAERTADPGDERTAERRALALKSCPARNNVSICRAHCAGSSRAAVRAARVFATSASAQRA